MIVTPSWLDRCSTIGLRKVLLEYGYFVHRFTQFIGLIIGHSEDADVRRLLLPNLIEEIGKEPENPAHVDLFNRCARSCGVTLDMSSVSSETKVIESWFFSVFDSNDTARSLAVLGPGTEEIAQSFLVPLERSLTKAFPSLDRGYFEAHRPEKEAKHIDDIYHAIKVLREKIPEVNKTTFDKQVSLHSQEAIEMHAQFWGNMRKIALGDK